MNIYDFTVKDIEGNEISMEKYRGKTLLIINTAPGCFFANQYKALEELYQEMAERDFIILDFPCNQFMNQAKGNSQEIHCQCQEKYGITFEQFEKVDVNGENAHPLFVYLREKTKFIGYGFNRDSMKMRLGYNRMKRDLMKHGVAIEKDEIHWNFTKFLVDKNGEVVARFEPPEPVEIVKNEVNKLLNGEVLSKQKRYFRKEKKVNSDASKKLFWQRLRLTCLFFLITYKVSFVFDLYVLQYNGIQVFDDRVMGNIPAMKQEMINPPDNREIDSSIPKDSAIDKPDEKVFFLDMIFEDRSTVKKQLLMPIPGSLFLAITFCGFSTRNSKKVNKLCAALEQAGEGNFNYRLKVNENDLYARPFKDFNVMCRELKDTMGNLQNAVEAANQANEAKSSFLSNMSHEIRTPLNSVLGMDEMIIRESTEEPIVEYALNIKNAGRTLLSLINDILDFSKIEANKLEIIPIEYELSSVINDLINMVKPKAESKGLELVVHVDSQMPHFLYGDEIRIKQVCLNIVNNAIKYTEHGTVTVMFNGTEVDGSNAISFSCVDTGQGIKEEDISKLTQPFVRIEEKKNRTIEGTGLGMSITTNILSLMGSKLEVESEYGKGSRFSFILKQEATSVEPIGDFEEKYRQLQENRKIYSESFRAPDARILIVDDVEMNLTVAKNFLKRTLIQVSTSTSGREAIQMSESEKYDLILVDHMMPDMDGIDTMKAIRTGAGVNQKTPIIVLTANAVSGAREKYLAEGFDDYLTKPIDGDRLEKTIKMYLDAALIEVAGDEKAEVQEQIDNPILLKIGAIKNVDTEEGVKNCGDPTNYMSIVENFGNTAAGRIDMIDRYFQDKDVKNYTIQVHALKSSARLVGQMELSELAKELEQAGNENDWEKIQDKTAGLLSEYENLSKEICNVFSEDEEKELIDPEMLKDGITTLFEALTVFDMDMADDVVSTLSGYQMPNEFASVFEEIKTSMSNVDRDEVLRLINDSDEKWR